MKKLLILLLALAFQINSVPLVANAQQTDLFVPISWNRDTAMIGNQEISRIYTSYKNWYDGIDWKTIDLMPRVSETDVHKIVVDKAPYTFEAPDNADGEFIFKDDGVYNIKTKLRMTSPEFVKTKKFRNIQPVGASSVAGGILYKNAFISAGADLFIKFRTDGVEYLIKFDALPPHSMKGKDVQVCFDDVYSGIKGDRDIITQKRSAYDSSPIPQRIDLAFKDGCKIIPYDFLEKAVFPVYADDVDTLYVDTYDAHIGRDACGGTSWSTMVNATSSNYDACESKSQTATSSFLYEYNSGGTNADSRNIAGFQNNLAVDDTITAANYCIYKTSHGGSSYDIVTTTGSTVSNTTLNSLDYGTFPNATVHPPQEIATRIAVADFSNNAYKCIPLNSSGISYLQTRYNSIFWLGLRLSHDADGAGSSLNNDFNFNSNDNASNKPYIEITYTPAPSSSSSSSSGSGASFGTGSLLFGETVCSETQSGSCIRYDLAFTTEFVQWVQNETAASALRISAFEFVGYLNVVLISLVMFILFSVFLRRL